MDAGDLRIFEAVARLGGMNKAAAELNTVQSNVTSRIRLLEERVGVPLFRRHTRGVALTNAGERLLPYARKIARLLSEAKRAVEDDGTPKGSLKVGSLETTAAYRLPPLVCQYSSAFPKVNVSLKTGTNLQLIESVLNHELEGAFVCGPVDHPELAQSVVFYEELVVATAPGQPRLSGLMKSGEQKILVKGPGCAYRQRFEEMLIRRGIKISQIEFGTLDAIIGCVSAGLGETLLPKSVLTPAAKEGRIAIHTLSVTDARVETLFIRRNDGFISSALGAFLELALGNANMAEAAE